MPVWGISGGISLPIANLKDASRRFRNHILPAFRPNTLEEATMITRSMKVCSGFHLDLL
jgi:hypothetical protein